MISSVIQLSDLHLDADGFFDVSTQLGELSFEGIVARPLKKERREDNERSRNGR